MKKLIVIGKTNAGKTLFTLNFAAFLGIKTVRVTFTDAQRGRHTRDFATSEAIRFLVGDKPHQTRCLQSITLSVPWGKGKKEFELIDTAGLTEGIHTDESIRKAMAQTLTAVREADIILHIFDSTEKIGEVDYQVAQFSQLRHGYAILANKIDLPQTQSSVERLQQEFPGHVVIPISSLHKQGFKEVKEFVTNQL